MNNFQLNIKNWQGRDLSERSFVQVHSGSLRRRLADHGEETEEREVTLFDNQMAICMTVIFDCFQNNIEFFVYPQKI